MARPGRVCRRLGHRRSAAEHAAGEHLAAKIIAAQGEPARPAQLQLLLDKVASLGEGAFAPPPSRPVVRAVLPPVPTYGGTWLAHIDGLAGG